MHTTAGRSRPRSSACTSRAIRGVDRRIPQSHSARPRSARWRRCGCGGSGLQGKSHESRVGLFLASQQLDRKSTRLKSSHSQISYAVFCLKKKKKKQNQSIVVSKKKR